MNPRTSLRASRFAFPVLALAIVAFAVAPRASADEVGCGGLTGWTAASSGITAATDTSGYWSLGTEFVATSNETVCALGVYAGLEYTTWIVVALYDAEGNLIADAPLNPYEDAQLDNGYYWTSIDAQLAAGETYYVVEYTNGNAAGWDDGDTLAMGSGATYLGSYYSYSDNNTGITFPTTSATNEDDPYYGANFMTSTPEPQSLILLGSGLAGLAGFLRFRLRKK